MHELAITRSLLDLVLEHAARAGGGRVTEVHVAVGEFTDIASESVRFYWDILCAGSPASGACLRFRRVAALFECRDCGARFRPHVGFRCSTCASVRVRLVAGDDLQLEAIDLDSEVAESRHPEPTGPRSAGVPRPHGTDSRCVEDSDCSRNPDSTRLHEETQT